MSPVSLSTRALSATRRRFSAWSAAEKPRSRLSPLRTTELSSTTTE